jgi:hypothetical protein
VTECLSNVSCSVFRLERGSRPLEATRPFAVLKTVSRRTLDVGRERPNTSLEPMGLSWSFPRFVGVAAEVGERRHRA